MSFSNASAADLNQIITLTTYLGDADNLLRSQTEDVTTNDLEDVVLATTTTLTGTYNNSAKTITGASYLTVDTIILNQSLDIGKRILVKNQSNGYENGIYILTTITPYVLTRASDFDTSSEILNFSKVRVMSGSVNENKVFFLQSGGNPTLGTTPLVFSEYPSGSTSSFLLKEFRKGFDTLKTESEFDNAKTLINTARALEISLPTTLNSSFGSVCSGLNTFYSAQYGASFKTYFKDAYALVSTVWSENFRTLWRSSMNEELVVKLGSVTKTSGAWGSFVADKTISLNSALVMKNKFDVTSGSMPSGITTFPVTLVLGRADGTTYSSTISMPVDTLQNTLFDITSTGSSTFTSIISVTIADTYGIDNNVIEFWVKG